MRRNQAAWARSLRCFVLAAAGVSLAASDVTATTVDLVAAPFTKNVVLPDGTTVSVPMWGYGLDLHGSCVVDPAQVSAPGPRISVGPDETSLTVNLRNCLSQPTSLVIPGQPFSPTPVRNAGNRVTAMTAETAPNTTGAYTFTGVRAGTFLYQSGSHPAVQVQMGLYGAMTKDAVAAVPAADPNPGSLAEAYADVPYAHEAVLVYSEIDQALHHAVCPSIVGGNCTAGTYGTASGPTSTIDYRPSLFLVNGESYTSASATIPAGSAGQPTLLRILNAGLRTHAPVLDNGLLTIVAEDGNPLPFAKDQAAILLAAGKTHDALWTPEAEGSYSLYDRTLSLNAPGQGSAGMLARLKVAAAGTDTSVYANDDSYSTSEGAVLTVGPAGVLGNDTGSPTSAAAGVAPSHASSFTLHVDGSFDYTPQAGFFGVDSFTYTASDGTHTSQPASVRIAVGQSQRAPVALPQQVGVNSTENVAVALTGSDPNGDPLSFYVTSLPAHGKVSVIGLGSVERELCNGTTVTPACPAGTPSDLHTATNTGTVVPNGIVVYTPSAGYPVSPATSAPDAFGFVAFDGGRFSASAAQVTATVYPADADAQVADLQTPVTLVVLGGDGTPILNYRWTLEEDLTYKVVPGVPDPNTLAVSFHKSYMPVVASGCVGSLRCDTPPDEQGVKVNSNKRYFVSVLPTEGTYSNSGAEIEAGQGTVTITAATLPLPTARIRVRVFQDNAPLNGMWDTDETGLQNFQVTIDDAGGTYGMSGGPQSTDAFGNKIGTTYQPCQDANGNPTPGACDSYQVARLGDGFVLTDADGYAVIENLVMGKYTVKVRAPGGDKWIQTTTVEGQPGIDAWVKPNEPQFFTEFGPPGPHVFVGFTRAVDGTGPLAALPGPYSTIKGRVTNLRQSRPIAVAQFSGAPFNHTRAWVALNSGATGGTLLYTQPTNEDGTFSIAHVPSGTYQLVVFDSALDLIIGSAVVNVDAVASATTDVHDVAVFNWFTNLYSFVFDDANRDGIHQADERGIPDQALNIRFRDGSIYQSLSTDERGFKAFNEVFPFFAWQVAEVDYTRFHSTGLTVVADGGGDAGPTSPNYGWRDLPGISLPAEVKKDLPAEAINPQPQPDNGGAPFRTESGAETPFLLLEGFQSFIGQSTLMMWGKAPYEKPGTFTEDVNVAPLDVFCPSDGGPSADRAAHRCTDANSNDTDANHDGFFNTDRSNGGIAGIVHYGITRAENDPRWAAAENWEPGVSDVRVQLWDANRTHLLNEVRTDNWNNSLPEGCQWPGNAPYVYQGRTTDCFDGLRNFNQARPALFDGGYAFSTILQDSVASATYDLPVEQRGVARPLPAGRYVVKIVVPPGYVLQKEEDKNVDFGDNYVPQQFWLDGYPLADGGAGEAQPAPTVTDTALLAPFCVGRIHEVPGELALFPGQPGAFAGEMRPLCDAKLVNLRAGQNGAADFYLFTEAPVAGHVYGMVLDDTTNEFDPNSPTFGEKYAVPFIGVAIRDWQGREVTRTYTDQYGMYNALVPSSYTANPPEPSGVSPSVLAACINPPTMPGPGGTVVADPHFQKQYSHFCYPLQYLAGKTTYLDTPVLPTGAFTGNGTFPVDAEFPDGTPVIASVTGPEPGYAGPYLVDRGAANAASRTIVIRSAGSVQVANPAFDGDGTPPKLITRDYGFGTSGTVLLENGPSQVALGITAWSNTEITAVVPTGWRTGQLSVVRGSGPAARKSTLGITLSVATPEMHAARAPVVVGPAGSIQAAIDAAQAGDLILVTPGVHEEMVVMTRPVRLQGAGALSTAINVVTTPAENVQAWLDKMGNLLLASPTAGSPGSYMLPNQPAMTPAPFQSGDVAAVVGDEGPGVMVLGKNELSAGVGGAPLVNAATSLLGPLGTCLTTRALGLTSRNFGAPANDAYCLQNENYTGVLTSTNANAAWRPNARIDGLSLIGASNAPGVLVNGYARYLEVSNNKIYTNSGTFAGGIHVGHVGAAAPFSDEDAHNENVAIHNNMVTQNAGNEVGGGGGVVLGTGSTGYVVKNNFIAANLTAGNGGGIAHIGLSQVGVIDHNTVVFNESFTQAVGTNGGGIFIGGTPAAAGAATLGSGTVDVTNNLVQGNAASGGDGGGIALLGFAGTDRVRLFNNMVVNNVAGLAGGGIGIGEVPTGGGAPVVDIVHNTIADNDSTATAGGAFTAGPLTSVAQPAGIAGRGSMEGVRIANSIVWHNRTFYFGPCLTPACGVIGPPGAAQFGEIQDPGRVFWDLGVLGGAAFSPVSSVISGLTDGASYTGPGTDNTSAAPAFVASYFNTDRRHAYQVGETTGESTLISTPAALDEGGNFIRPQFGPLSLENPGSTPPNQPFGNYHVTAGVGGANLATGGGALYNGVGNVPNALATDFDGDPRPVLAPHRGADQVAQAAPPTLASIAPNTGLQGATNLPVSLTGTNLGGATAVTVSGTGVTCGVTGSTSTTVAANCSITAGATTGARAVSVTTPGGTSNTVTFTVTAPPPGTVSFTSAGLGTLSNLLGTLFFGNINSTTVASTVTLTVGGGTPVTFGNATVSDGAGAGTFSKLGDTCSGTTRAVGATCTITIRLVMPGNGFTPSAGSLSVPHNGSGAPATLALSGS
jgi:large repetitive protein